MIIMKTKNNNKFRKLIKLSKQHNSDISETRNSSHRPLDLLILLILNQSTSDSLSDRAFLRLKQTYPSYLDILKENNLDNLQQTISICGLANSKAQYILNLLHHLHRNNNLHPDLPFLEAMDDAAALKELTSIKGIGVKSASCLLMFAFRRNTFPIDTHIFRVLKRVGEILIDKVSSQKAHQIIQSQIHEGEAFMLHVSLIELGRNICHARGPFCERCYLSEICCYHQDKQS